MSDLETLIKLQAVDSEIDEGAQRLEVLRAALTSSEEVRAARQAQAASEAALQAAEKRQRDLEWDAADRSAKIKAADAKLYGGTIKSSKELSSLQTEVEHWKQALALVEEQTLEAMSTAEAARTEARVRRSELDEIEARRAVETRAMKAEGQALQRQLSTLRARRDEVAAGLARPLVQRYEELRRTRRGLAVARVERNVCQGCRTDIPTSQVQAARTGQIVYCSSCGRVLHVPR